MGSSAKFPCCVFDGLQDRQHDTEGKCMAPRLTKTCVLLISIYTHA